MPPRVCLIDLPGLSRELLSSIPADSALGKWIATQTAQPLKPSWPAVTCSVQATLTTGVGPEKHGIVANGIPTFRSAADQALVDASNFAGYRRQISFWEQSNQFVQVPRFWQDSSGRSKFKTALLFFQHCMPGFAGEPKPSADIVLTPKPDHGPDGKFISLCWSNPPELVPSLFKELGPFPLMNYWGPMAGINASAWIAKAAEMVWRLHQPQLQLVYVPHLDYDLQRFGPDSAQAQKAVVDVATAMEPLINQVLAGGAKLVLLSEYSIAKVTRSIAPNRLLKEAGLLKTRQTEDGVLIDYENSDAVAMVDHQIAHVYLKSPALAAEVKKVLLSPLLSPLLSQGKVEIHDRSSGLNHPRAGDLQLQAAAGTWFDYRWWTDPGEAPAFARMVDIHRKPGYDPMELFLEPNARAITQDASRIGGSHGACPGSEGIICGVNSNGEMTGVAGEILKLLGE
jgi:predicted AlkP superfamily pyrophosphatase or phosphodiesterase